MNKSILILDNNPEKCEECQFLRYIPIDQKQCNASIRLIKKRLQKPNWCPLRQLPEKLGQGPGLSYWNGVTDGWNQCTDEITGEDD